MQFRVGKCGSCQATFKVPASFGGDKAKCKSCGTGVVVIGPIEDDEDKLEEHKPSGKQASGPSMMERLRAERATAAEAKPLPAKKPSPQKPAGERTAKSKKPSAPAATGSKPSRPKRAATRKPAGGEPRAASKRGERTSRTTARRAGGTRGRRSGSEGGDEESGGRRGRAQQKKSPAPLIGGILLALVVGLGLWQPWATEPSTTAGTETAQADPAPTATEAEEASTPAEEPTPEEPAAEEPEPEPDPEPEPAAQPTQKITASTPDSEVDPNEIDLSAFEPLSKDPDCSDEQWAEILTLTIAMADQDSPRQANQAVAELALLGRFAYPAMVNEFMKLDLTTYEGHRQGDYYQRAMETLLGGRNYGWKYDFDAEPNKTALFNKKVVRNYYKTGGKIAGKPNAWNDLSKNEDNTNRPEPEPEPDTGLSEDDLDDLDDLDF